MSLLAYQFRMPQGFPGDVNAVEIATIEPNVIDVSVTPPAAFGLPVKIVAGKIQPINNSADTAALVYGFNVREYPSQGPVNDPLGTSTPPQSGAVSVLRRGQIIVQVNGTATPVKGGQVYVRVAGAATGKPVGGVEAAADATSANTIAINATFMGGLDSSGNALISFNI